MNSPALDIGLALAIGGIFYVLLAVCLLFILVVVDDIKRSGWPVKAALRYLFNISLYFVLVFLTYKFILPLMGGDA